MKRLLAAMTAALLMVALVSSAAFAGSTSLMGQAWRAYNVKPATSSFWDINKVKLTTPTLLTQGLWVPVQPFATQSTGSFLVYMLNNHNVDITGQTFTASMAWTAGKYMTRSPYVVPVADPPVVSCPGAGVRFEFQDTTAGPYDSNDYWWSYTSFDLNGAVTSGTLTAALTNRTAWYNQSGRPATDTTQDWVEWQGDVVHMSPFDGFTKAMKNVKQLGLSFGSPCASASGVALVGGTGMFGITAFDIAP